MRVILFFSILIVFVSGILLEDEWKLYKVKFQKQYTPNFEENVAKSNWMYNRHRVNKHNSLFQRGYYDYELAINGFSDRTFLEFSSHFPNVKIEESMKKLAVPLNQVPQEKFSYEDLGIRNAVKEQSLSCNSGWAFATASVLDLFIQYSSTIIESKSFSAQQFIDCAGMGNGCSTGLPHNALEYVILNQSIATDDIYSYTGEINYCLTPTLATPLDVNNYFTLNDGDDDQLLQTINYLSPAIVDVNPKSFEFMHYKSGIFTQPRFLPSGSHFMVVLGFDKNSWLLQNSFGQNWGNGGYIRIKRNPAQPITKSAIYPAY